MTEENFFVGLKEGIVLRKLILESSKEIILVLKSQQKIYALRSKKLDLINSLKGQIKELTLLLSKLESKMPSHEIFKDLKLEGFDLKPQPKPKLAKVEEKKAAQDYDELAKLENALDAIEQKLSKL